LVGADDFFCCALSTTWQGATNYKLSAPTNNQICGVPTNQISLHLLRPTLTWIIF